MMFKDFTTIPELIDYWNSGDGKPYKGSLIDWSAFKAQPDNIGCMCAQGQVLHLLGGWSPERLRYTEQQVADRETAKLLGISVAHAILLRKVNDSVDGAPSIVLTNPEKVIGDQAFTILAFWRHLDRMTDEQWAAARDGARAPTWDAARGTRTATWNATRAARATKAATWDVTRDVTRGATRDVTRATWDVTWNAARGAASYAVAEIMGAKVLRERGQPFFFLPMFGFADPEAVLTADAQEEV